MANDAADVARADPPFSAIETDRLIIRAPVIEDLDFIVARRNDPEVARYQDWTLPHPPEKTKAKLEAAIAQGGFVDGQSWMATVARRDTGLPIGDLYTKIVWDWRVAEVGYTFDSAQWGHGYAAEAFTAMLNHLFDDRGIVRASATLHPDNVASRLLLERAGFSFEGMTKQSFWVGDEISDDGFYGLTKADRDAWMNRPTGPATNVGLVEITHENARAVRLLETHKSQEQMVAPVAVSFANALFPEHVDGHPVLPRMWAIEADEDLAGFVMIADTTDHHPEPYLWRLLIDLSLIHI